LPDPVRIGPSGGDFSDRRDFLQEIIDIITPLVCAEREHRMNAAWQA
jgi:hypothetical protein